jgi:hypothetical protein
MERSITDCEEFERILDHEVQPGLYTLTANHYITMIFMYLIQNRPIEVS